MVTSVIFILLTLKLMEKLPEFKETFVFENDFYALILKKKIDKNLEINDDLFQLSSATGIAKVICFSAKHNLTMASMQ